MSIIDKLVKRFNNEDVIKFSDKDDFKSMKSWSSTGSPTLDYNLSSLGIPTGIVEVAGMSRSGKTTIALMAMRDFLIKNPDGICVILSSENRDNKDYATKLGIDTNRIMIVRVRYVEKMFMMVKKLIEDTTELYAEESIPASAIRFFFMWDSLGATLSKAELDTMQENTDVMSKKLDKGDDIGDLKHEKIGAFAKNAKMFAKFITGEMYDKVIHFVILNHQYDKIGGHGKKSTGGEWIEYMPTLRLSTVVKEHVKVGEEQVGQITKVSVVKNDFGSRKTTDIEILLGYGIVLSEEDLAFAVEKGVLKKEGAKKMSFMNGKLTWSTKGQFYDHYKDKNKLMHILHSKVTKLRHQQVLEERGITETPDSQNE
jgi:RecA/RadA recombinase